jgi:hypothetical protein
MPRPGPPWAALVLAAITLLPFLDKAYTIDDPVFLLESEHVLTDPLHPSAVEIVWSTDRRALASPFLPDARTAAYLLLPLAPFRWHEWAGHLLMMFYFGATIVGTTALARELGLSVWGQHAAALLTASAPVMLGMAGTVMPDIPAAMFTVWAMERLLVWTRTRNWHTGIAAALFLALATLSRIHLCVLLCVAFVWTLRRSWRIALPVALAFALAFAGFLVTRDPPGTIGATQAATQWHFQIGRSVRHVAAFYIEYLATTPLLVGLATRRRWEPSSLLWLWLLVPLPIVAYVHFAAKYVAPAVPAAAILAAYGLQRCRSRNLALGSLVGAGVTLGTLILIADSQMSGSMRSAAADLIRPRVAAGERVWFAGHWGFHRYAEAAGGLPLSLDPPYPEVGDVVVVSTVDRPAGLLCALPRVLLAMEGGLEPAGQVMSRAANAGFYSDDWGLLPWGWGPPDAEGFQVWRVVALPGHQFDPDFRPASCGP